MFQLSDGLMNGYADGALSTEEEAFQIVENKRRTEAMLVDTGITVGSAAFWGWLSSYRGGLPEIIAGTGITLDAVVGAGLLLVNVLGYGGEYEVWLTAAANGSLAHFAIKWAEGLGARMAAEAGTTAGYQYSYSAAA